MEEKEHMNLSGTSVSNSKVKVRLPNESYYTHLHNFDWAAFTKLNNFTNELFGIYHGIHIFVKK